MSEHLSLRVGTGRVLLDPSGGAPLQFLDPEASERRFLLDEGMHGFHTSDHRWGSGFLLSSAGPARWATPSQVRLGDSEVRAEYPLLAGLSLAVTRTGGDFLNERYEFINDGRKAVAVSTLAINTPFRDIYESAASSLAQAVHAHVWTGGEDSWVLAEPMSGTGWALGLVVRTGGLWSYSIESRNSHTSSDVRGHIVLHATDRGRNPTAFGGQPLIEIPAGSSWTLSWDVAFYADREAFVSQAGQGLRPDRLYAPIGETIVVRGPVEGLRVDGDASVSPADGEAQVSASDHRVVHLSTARHQTAVLFHAPLPELVRRRVRYILDHQRPHQRPEPGRHAFVPFDTATGLTQTTNGWMDWSDGAERVAMPTLLQEARRKGWVDSVAEVDEAVGRFAEFARTSLLDDTGAPRWDSLTDSMVRIYNSPWLAHFFGSQYGWAGEADDLGLAHRILMRSYELGAGRHLSIGQAEAVVFVADLLEQAGDIHSAQELRDLLLDQADYFLGVEADLPSHEVNYEQSMVAPLVTLYSAAEALQGAGRFLTVLPETVSWLRAFGGPQPHIRLRDIGIRHWDGFWFGRDRQWGDVFPHYWSVLTAVALRQLPEHLRTPETDRAADEIFHANLLNFGADGSASCAFVLPSAVDGRPGYRADPLANDQDWCLTLWLRLLDSGDERPSPG